MLLGVYEKTQDRKWLEDSVPLIEKYYEFWTHEPHLTPETGLSRYFDLGEGHAPEVVSAERNAAGRTHYDLVKEYFKTHEITDYDVSQYYDRKTDELSMLFYKGDRSMRESGFDPSNRFGPFNIDIIHYDPVCLNSLLYLMETQMADILHILGREADVNVWRKRAQDRAERVNRLMWDAKDGLYYDYDFVNHRVRHYPFLTTFYPLWAGIATKEQAARVEGNLPLFEKVGGLQTSTYVSGNQWDAPFGWAPLQMIALEGLRRYGYAGDAERISMKFLSLVRREFLSHGYIVEKYDVVRGGSDVSANIHFGYSANQAGFGWTNAVFTELFDALTPEDKRKLMSMPGE
jgi:alpha,alpha-trehalase